MRREDRTQELGVRRQGTRGTREKFLLLLPCLPPLPCLSLLSLLFTTPAYPSPVRGVQTPNYPHFRNCQEQDIQSLTSKMLRDLPSYANRASQRARRLSRKTDIYSNVLVAGNPEFAPLTLGPGIYAPKSPTNDSEAVQQIFFTTLERQYVNGKPVELQEFHWLFLTKTQTGWRLATMFTQTGGYPSKKSPTPPRESSDGIIAQGVETWLRDCQARNTKD